MTPDHEAEIRAWANEPGQVDGPQAVARDLLAALAAKHDARVRREALREARDAFTDAATYDGSGVRARLRDLADDATKAHLKVRK